MPKFSEEQIADLKSKHGEELVMIDSPAGEMIFKKPSRPVWADFVDSMSKDKASKEGCLRRLALACVVSHTADEADAIFLQYVGLPAQACNEITDLAGAGGAKFSVKKL